MARANPSLTAHANRFRVARAAHRDETTEDYVEAIAQLIKDHGTARVKDLAAMMGVSHVTVSRTVRRICDAGFATTEPYKPIALTPKGKRLATKSRTRHEAVLSLLLAIGVPPKQASIDAEGLEHHASDATIRAMRRATAKLQAPG